jgi:hypoxanthine-DNA glycosylase
MTVEKHPYKEFIPAHSRIMIIGSFPIGKFSDPSRRQEIKKHEFDFFFGGEKNLLWKILSEVFEVHFKSSHDIKKFLGDKGIALGDVIISCRRKKGGGSDSDLYDIKWNTKLLDLIDSHDIKTVFFTSKKVEGWFNKLFPESQHLEKVTLISPSGQSVRSLYRREDYQKWSIRNPNKTKYDFIVAFYRQKFETHT